MDKKEMKTNNRLRKIRTIVQMKNPVYGVVLPPTLQHWLNVYVRVKESGNCIILESGGLPTPLSQKQFNEDSEKIDEVKI